MPLPNTTTHRSPSKSAQLYSDLLSTATFEDPQLRTSNSVNLVANLYQVY